MTAESPTSSRPDETDRSMTEAATSDTVEWETFALDPTLKGCGICREDVLGARVAIRPKLTLKPAWLDPEGLVVRVCSNCGHITTMGPIVPAIAVEWPVRNV